MASKYERAGWNMMYVWQEALEETARDFHGTHPQEFCVRAYAHATRNWIHLLREEYGIILPRTDSMKEAVESYIRASVEVGAFRSADSFRITDFPESNAIEVEILACPYENTCRELLCKGVKYADITCARIGCFRAAVLYLTGHDCRYDILHVRPNKGCRGIIERIN
jgi:hypothetical protein